MLQFGRSYFLKEIGFFNHQLDSKLLAVPTKTQLSNFFGTPGEDYFQGNQKSLNFYFLVIWWGKHWEFFLHTYLTHGMVQ